MSKLSFDFTGVSKEDIILLARELNEKIEYITSGQRDHYIAAKKRAGSQEDWARLFTTDLRVYGIKLKNTSYSAFNYGGHSYEVHVPYIVSSSGQTAIVGKWVNGKWKILGKTHSAKQAVAILIQEGLYHELQKIKA